jgi:class 3 adenylate cyclase/PAS domain-containing protein
MDAIGGDRRTLNLAMTDFPPPPFAWLAATAAQALAWLDADGTVLWANDAYGQWVGTDPVPPSPEPYLWQRPDQTLWVEWIAHPPQRLLRLTDVTLRQRYHELLDTPNCILARWDRQGRLLMLNDYGQKILGLVAVGQPVLGSLLPAVDVQGHPTATMLADIWHQPLLYLFYETTCIRSDGLPMWISWRLRPCGDREVLALGIEITELRESEEVLERSLSLLRSMFEAISDGVLALDTQGGVLSYNQSFLAQWSPPPDFFTDDRDMLARLSAITYQMQDPDRFVRHVVRILAEPMAETFELHHLKDYRIYEITSRPQHIANRLLGRVWTFRDVTMNHLVEEELRLEKEKSEQLLRNVFPEPIAERLKRDPGAIADHFNDVSVLFADIVGFTQISSAMSATDLVGLLNRIFSNFDALTERYRLEKIKTIGDAYMVVGGLPFAQTRHLEAIADMAVDLQKAIAQFRTYEGERVGLRVGIHTGAVVAGVIGTKRLIYDLWGDTVNIASRMESQGEGGKIQVTEAVYERLQERYVFRKRGTVFVKGKGPMVTYWLLGRLS